MKKILIISYNFPPDCTIGALRPTRFVKYLPEFGYEPYIITVRDRYYDVVDKNKNIPGNVLKTLMLPNPINFYGLTKWILNKLRRKRNISEHKKDGYLQNENQQITGVEGFSTRFKRFIILLCSWPDDKIGWLPFGFIRAYRLISKEKIDCIMTTSPPHSVHLIGFLLKKCLNIRWIADFRDPWMIDYFKMENAWKRSRVLDYCALKMEKRVVQMADKVVLVTERTREGYERFYPQIDKDKFVAVTNGYDLSDFSGLMRVKKFDKFTLTYTGDLYCGRTPLQFFVAVGELIEEKKISIIEINIRLVGNAKLADGVSVMEMAKEQGIESLVTISDSVPHKDALALMVRSHVLLLFAPERFHYQAPAKTYEYMASGSHIIAFATEGATKDLIRNYKMGTVVDSDNIAGIKEAVYIYYKKYLEAKISKTTKVNGTYTYKNDEINKYEGRELTRRLTTILQ